MFSIVPAILPNRCRANIAHLRHSRPDSGFGFQVKAIQTLSVVPHSLQSRLSPSPVQEYAYLDHTPCQPASSGASGLPLSPVYPPPSRLTLSASRTGARRDRSRCTGRDCLIAGRDCLIADRDCLICAICRECTGARRDRSRCTGA